MAKVSKLLNLPALSFHDGGVWDKLGDLARQGWGDYHCGRY